MEQVVDQEQIDGLIALARELAGIDLDDPATWDVTASALATWAHQAQWDVRQHPRVHHAFAELWQDEALVVSQDALGFKPPTSSVPETRREPGGLADSGAMALHWDLNPREGRWLYHGVLYLTDVGMEDGAFRGVPGIFRDLDGWLTRHPDADLSGDTTIDLESHPIVPVCAKAGDMVVFNSRLPHGNAANRGSHPRLVQYVSMFPAGFWGERREDHAELYLTGMPNPTYRWKPGWDTPAPSPPAQLTPLGRKLAGLDPW